MLERHLRFRLPLRWLEVTPGVASGAMATYFSGLLGLYPRMSPRRHPAGWGLKTPWRPAAAR